MEPPLLHLDRSEPHALFFERNGKPVDLETVFRHGFTVSPDDAPAILTLVVQFLKSKGRDE